MTSYKEVKIVEVNGAFSAKVEGAELTSATLRGIKCLITRNINAKTVKPVKTAKTVKPVKTAKTAKTVKPVKTAKTSRSVKKAEVKAVPIGKSKNRKNRKNKRYVVTVRKISAAVAVGLYGKNYIHGINHLKPLPPQHRENVISTFSKFMRG